MSGSTQPYHLRGSWQQHRETMVFVVGRMILAQVERPLLAKFTGAGWRVYGPILAAYPELKQEYPEVDMAMEAVNRALGAKVFHDLHGVEEDAHDVLGLWKAGRDRK